MAKASLCSRNNNLLDSIGMEETRKRKRDIEEAKEKKKAIELCIVCQEKNRFVNKSNLSKIFVDNVS